MKCSWWTTGWTFRAKENQGKGAEEVLLEGYLWRLQQLGEHLWCLCKAEKTAKETPCTSWIYGHRGPIGSSGYWYTGPVPWVHKREQMYWQWPTTSPSGWKYFLFQTKLHPHVLRLYWMKSLQGLGVPTTSILTKAESMRVLYFLNCVSFWKSGRQEQALATPAVMVRLNASIEL